MTAHAGGPASRLASAPAQPLLGPGSFGHTGAGGQLAFADVDYGASFAYRQQPDGRLRRRPGSVARGRPPVCARWLEGAFANASPWRRAATPAAHVPGLARRQPAGAWATCSTGRSTACSAASTSCRPTRPRATAGSRRSRTSRSIRGWAPGPTSNASPSARRALDVMINHLSRRTPEFRDFVRWPAVALCGPVHHARQGLAGRRPAGRTWLAIFLRKPKAPFSSVRIEATGETERVWTSFGTESGRSRSTWTSRRRRPMD